MYIEQTDLEKGIFPEVLKVISRDPENIAQAIREAMEEVAAYLSSRFKIYEEYQLTGENRNILVVKMVREVALYNCYNIANPSTIPESKESRYKGVIAFLKDVQSERAGIDGLSRLDSSTATGSSFLKYGCNTRRKNSFN